MSLAWAETGSFYFSKYPLKWLKNPFGFPTTETIIYTPKNSLRSHHPLDSNEIFLQTVFRVFCDLTHIPSSIIPVSLTF